MKHAHAIIGLALGATLSLTTGRTAQANSDACVPCPAATAATAATAAPAAAPLDLNRATSTELEALPRIGRTRAEAILRARERMGGFTRVSQLLRVKGIGRATLRMLRPHVMVGPRKPPKTSGGTGKDPLS